MTYLMSDNSIDILAVLIVIVVVDILRQMIRVNGLGWRDYAVMTFMGSTILFFSLIALRRIMNWPLEIAVMAFALKLIGSLGIDIHMRTQKNGTRP